MKEKYTDIFVYCPTYFTMSKVLTCSGSTWQNIEIFSFTAISIGFALLQTICHNIGKKEKHKSSLEKNSRRFSLPVMTRLTSFGSTVQASTPFFFLPSFGALSIYHSSHVSSSKAKVISQPALTDPFVLIFLWHPLQATSSCSPSL